MDIEIREHSTSFDSRAQALRHGGAKGRGRGQAELGRSVRGRGGRRRPGARPGIEDVEREVVEVLTELN